MRSFALLVLVLVAVPRAHGAEAPPLWGALEPGPHAVGFHSVWMFDPARTYDTTFSDGSTYAGDEDAPRPLLVQLWYPAELAADSSPMAHRQYLDVPDGDDERTTHLADALERYAWEVIIGEVTQDEPGALDEAREAPLLAILDSPTAAHRDAPAVDGPFPLVIYHSGAGASFEDNAVLCEFLASHGYVVIGSAFQKADGSRLAGDQNEGSFADVAVLVEGYAAALRQVDIERVAMVGHSAGAQAALRLTTRDPDLLDAVVSLDTTEDYLPRALPMWAALRDETPGLRTPVLMVAGPAAIFATADTWVDAERLYLTLPHLDHNDYISQGVQTRRFATLTQPDDESAQQTYEQVSSGYSDVVHGVLAFLDAQLKGDDTRLNALWMRSRFTYIGEGPHLESMPADATATAPFDSPVDAVPTPRQLRRMLDDEGVDEVLLWLAGAAPAREPPSPLLDDVFAAGWLLELVRHDRVEEARALHAAFGEYDVPVIDTLRGYAELGRMFGYDDVPNLCEDVIAKLQADG